MRFRGKVDGIQKECISRGIGTLQGQSKMQSGIVEKFWIQASERPAFPEISLTSHAKRSLGDPEVNHEMLEVEVVSKIRRCPRPEIGQHSAFGPQPRGSAAIRRNSYAAGVGTGSSGSEADSLGSGSADVRGAFEIGRPMSYLSTLPIVGKITARLCLPPAPSSLSVLPGRVVARFLRHSFLSDP